MKSSKKLLNFIIILLLFLSFLSIFFISKNNKILKKQVKLNYDKTYEQAFPDKEFRRLILTMLYKYNERDYGLERKREHFDTFYHAIKLTGDLWNAGIDKALTDEELNRYSKDKLDKNFLEKIVVIHTNPDTETYKKIANLDGVEYLPNLEVFAISGSNIKVAHFNYNPMLETLFLPERFYQSHFKHYVQGTSKLDNVDIRNNRNLRHLILNFEPHKENTIDLSGNPDLEAIYIESSSLKEIDLTNKERLMDDKNIKLENNNLQLIKADKANPGYKFGASNQKIKVNAEKGVPIRIPLKVNNYDAYLEGSGFTRENDVYTFNQVGTHYYNFNDDNRDYSGTVEVNIIGGDSKNFTPLITNDSRCYVNQSCSLADKIYNIPRDANVVSVTSCDQGNATGIILVPNQKGLGTCDVKITFGDGSTGTYKVKIPVFEQNIKAINQMQFVNRKNKYVEGELSKSLTLLYSEIGNQRDDYLNILNKKNKCNYETFICDKTVYNENGYFHLLKSGTTEDKSTSWKSEEYDDVNNQPILDSKVKVYNSKQMEQVVRNHDKGTGGKFIDWQGDEEEKIYYIFPIQSNVETLENPKFETTILRDTDHDGIPDKDDEDDDNDGISDAQEVLDQTDPKDASSFKVTKICYKVKG